MNPALTASPSTIPNVQKTITNRLLGHAGVSLPRKFTMASMNIVSYGT